MRRLRCEEGVSEKGGVHQGAGERFRVHETPPRPFPGQQSPRQLAETPYPGIPRGAEPCSSCHPKYPTRVPTRNPHPTWSPKKAECSRLRSPRSPMEPRRPDCPRPAPCQPRGAGVQRPATPRACAEGVRVTQESRGGDCSRKATMKGWGPGTPRRCLQGLGPLGSAVSQGETFKTAGQFREGGGRWKGGSWSPTSALQKRGHLLDPGCAQVPESLSPEGVERPKTNIGMYRLWGPCR